MAGVTVEGAKLLLGKPVADAILDEAAATVARLRREHGVTPGLAAVLVGEDPASEIYVRNKTRACQRAGVLTETVRLPPSTPQQALLTTVRNLNRDTRFHGVLVQLPLPSHINEDEVIERIDPEKDVDGLHPINVGRLAAGRPSFVAATPLGIQQILMRGGYDPAGKHVVVCGRSEIVGKPIAMLLMQKASGADATVTVCHTRTRDVGAVTRLGDIVIVSTGRPRWLGADMVKEGAVVIDVGIHRIPDPTAKSGTRLIGDVDFEAVRRKAAAITPVPGGVGPVTVASVVHNTVAAAERLARYIS